jgi:hypothetical protein
MAAQYYTEAGESVEASKVTAERNKTNVLLPVFASGKNMTGFSRSSKPYEPENH